MLKVKSRKLNAPVRVKVRVPEKVVEPFYQSAAWRALTHRLKASRWPILRARAGHCCEDISCREIHGSETRYIFDHVKERRDFPALSLDPSNIMSRCWASHARKTAAARAARYHG